MESAAFESSEVAMVKMVVASLPMHAVKDLLSLGVCPRCVFRLLGVKEKVYSFSFLSTSFLCSVLENTVSFTRRVEDHVPEKGLKKKSAPSEPETTRKLCSICFGILQLVYTPKKEPQSHGMEDNQVVDVAVLVANLVKNHEYEADSFSLEVSVPSASMESEEAIWSYMKSKYGSEDWFNQTVGARKLSVKDALKLTITNSLENLLSIRSAASSFHIRMTYTARSISNKAIDNHDEFLHNCRKRKSDYDVTIPGKLSLGIGAKEEKLVQSLREVESCDLEVICFRNPICLGGRYLKYSRNVSQTKWIIDDERMGEASVEELIGKAFLAKLKVDSFKFHAAGREDIDVRMLGSGRPFLIELVNSRRVPSSHDIREIVQEVNNNEPRLIKIKYVKVVGNEGWDLMREGEAEKQKQYAALVWISRSLTENDLEKLCNIKDLEVIQRTPVRVLHRRSPLERKRLIHWMKGQRIADKSQYFMLHLCTQAGTYIKEFVHGDIGCTHPSLGSILGCTAEILQLDVTDVKMDCFNQHPRGTIISVGHHATTSGSVDGAIIPS